MQMRRRSIREDATAAIHNHANWVVDGEYGLNSMMMMTAMTATIITSAS